ncbi:MAG: helicase-related protein, partial [Pseudomonadota bacterium]
AKVQSGLVIVNTRRHARQLFELMQCNGIEGAHHLTTAMSAAHRSYVLDKIRQDLKQKQPARLVATSLIEAGVDISFQAVWRAWAGLDQIAQAAGRCNREGEFGPQGGYLTIFDPEPGEGRNPPYETRANAEVARSVCLQGKEVLSQEAIAEYFSELLWRKEDEKGFQALDCKKVGENGRWCGIMRAIEDTADNLDFPFADIAHAFRIIEDTMVPVIIPKWIHPIAGIDSNIEERITAAAFRKKSGSKSGGIGGILRDLQRFVVQVPRPVRANLLNASAAKAIAPDVFGDQFIILQSKPLYSDKTGLHMDDPTYR